MVKSKNSEVKTLSEFFNMPFALLSMTGIKLIYWDANDRMTRGEKLGLLYLLFNTSTGLSGKVNFLFNGTLETTLDYTALTIYWIYVLNTLTKLVTIVAWRRNVEFILKAMAKTFPTEPLLSADYEVMENFTKIDRCNRYLTIFNMITTCMFNAFPLLQSFMEYGDDGVFSYRLQFMLAYPFDVRKPLNYGLAYFLQAAASFNTSLIFLGSDLVLITSVRLINMYFKYLMKRINDFRPNGTHEDIRQFGEIIKFHEEIYGYTQSIDQMYNISIFMNYLATGMVVCLLGYQIVAGTELLNLIKFFCFIVVTSAHIYFIASAAQDMTDSSTDVSDAFFHHRWYSGSVHYQRLMTISIARAQRPAHLNAFKFFVISMESFKTFLSTSYQFFALINTQLES